MHYHTFQQCFHYKYNITALNNTNRPHPFIYPGCGRFLAKLLSYKFKCQKPVSVFYYLTQTVILFTAHAQTDALCSDEPPPASCP